MNDQEKIHNALHILQHKLLPGLFYEGKAGFVEFITDKEPNGIYEVFRQIIAAEQVDSPYEPEAFSRKMLELTDGRTADAYKEFALIVTYPEPEIASLCFKSFFLFNATCSHRAYYTLEKMEMNGKPYIYEWNEDLTHPFRGTVSFDEEMQLRRLVELYLAKVEENVR